MENSHPIEKKPRPVPHDPRNEPLPEKEKEGRSAEEAEKKARKEEGVGLKGPKKGFPSGASADEKQRDREVTEDEYGLPTGIRVSGNSTPGTSPDPRS